MDPNLTCPGCHKPLGPGLPMGLCPECLIQAGFPTGAASAAGSAPSSAFVPPAIDELAKIFPQLEILELIGRGGMGAVYKARQKQLNRLVALKILPPGIGRDPAFAERFAREARALAQLNHPGIVTLYEFGEASGQFYFLMELVDGVNLRQLLAGSRISAREALAIVPQICDALQYAHDQGIVHRDIKPENILLDRRGRVKVADFGLAKLVGQGNEPAAASVAAGSPTLTEAGKIMGTPQYMSPEQIKAPGEVDNRADIYALGVVFYQMLTGELPGKKIEPPSHKVQIDVRLDEVVLRALEQKPELRFQQASVMKTQVETIAGTPDLSATGGPLSPGEGVSSEKPEGLKYGRFGSHILVGMRAGQRVINWPQVILAGLVIYVALVVGLYIAFFKYLPFSILLNASLGATILITGAMVKTAWRQPESRLADLDQRSGANPSGASIPLPEMNCPLTMDAWLALVDTGEYARSWETAAPYFQRAIGRDEWVARLEKVRRPLGEILARKLNSLKSTVLGTRWEAKYEASFSGLPAAAETVTYARQSNGEWQPVGYLIRPAQSSKPNWPLWPVWFCLLAGVLSIEAFQWWRKHEPMDVWLPTLISDSIGEQYGEAQLRVTDVSQLGQVVLVNFVCDTPYTNHELFVQYSGPALGYPADLAATVTSRETNLDCLIAPNFMNGGIRVLAGTREMAGKPSFQIGFVLPDAKVAATAAEQIRQVHLDKPRGLKRPQSTLLLFSLHRRVGEDTNGQEISENLSAMLCWPPFPASTASSNDFTFGPVLGRPLLFQSNGETSFFSLESNQFLRPVATTAPGSIAFMDDSESNGIIVGSIGLGNNRFMPVPAPAWDSLTPSRCVELAAAKTNWFGPVEFQKSDLPVAFLVRTDSGYLGVMRVAGISNGETGVDLQYKFLTRFSTNTVFPADEYTDANPPGGSKPIPPEAVKLFNQSRDLYLSVGDIERSRDKSWQIALVRVIMQQEEIAQKLAPLVKDTPFEPLRWRGMKAFQASQQIDQNKDREKWNQLTTERNSSQFKEERLMVDAGAADSIQPDAGKLQFGPWIEATLLHPSAGSNCCLDFDSGAILTPPPEILAAMTTTNHPGKDFFEAMPESFFWAKYRASSKDTNALARWIEHNNVDAVPLGSYGLVVLCSNYAPMHEEDTGDAADWERQVTPAWLLWKLFYSRKINPAPTPPNTYEVQTFPDSALGPGKALCLFRTRSGRPGILQITGFTDNPPGIKFHYKLVQNMDGKTPTGASAGKQ